MHKLYCDKSELSLGQLYLLDICDNRKITDFWNEKLNQSFSVGMLMKIATGKYKLPSLNFIYALKDFVQPYLWFYTESEYINKVDTLIPIEKEDFTEDIRLSKNFCKIMNLYEKKELWKFCEEYFGENFQVKYMTFIHIINGRNSVSPTQIKELESIFLIEDWFSK